MTIKALYPTSRPSLNLDFANTKALDPRVTFSRASAGTYVDADGLIKSAASGAARFDHSPTTGESLGLLVEESRTNLLNYSEDFASSSYWTAFNVAVSRNVNLTPNNTFTGQLVIPSVTFSQHSVYKTSLGGAGTYTATIYAKANGYNTIQAYLFAGNFLGTATARLDTGTVVIGGTGSPSGSIASMGNGWYRVTITATASSAFQFGVYIGNNGSVDNFSGTGTSGVYLWGAQLEAGAFPTSYIPTPVTFTSRASTATFYDSAGIIQTAASGVARSNAFFPDENNVFRPAGLLLEAAGTNLLNSSQTFAASGGIQNDWTDTSITRDDTLRTSPDGTANALRITAASGDATIISSAAIGTSAERTFSIFLRRVTGSGDVQYTLDNGSSWTTQAITSSWQRYIFSATTADQQVGIKIVASADAIELWGAQLEVSPYATSYIPTTTATVTRAADVSSSATVTRSADVASITGANFSSWYNPSEGTTYSETRNVPFGGGFWYYGPTGSPRWWARYEVTNGIRSQVYGGGASSATVTTTIPGITGNPTMPTIKHAAAVDDITRVPSASVNGAATAGGTGSSTSIAGISALSLGIRTDTTSRLNGCITRFTYWPTRLSDATLQALTQ